MARKRKYTPNAGMIANKLRKMIQARIKAEDLIDTGYLYNSIHVVPDDDYGFVIYAADYFKYLNEPYDILDSVINSREFNDYMRDVIADEIDLYIRDI